MVGEVPLSVFFISALVGVLHQQALIALVGVVTDKKVLGVNSLVGDNTDQGGDAHKRLK